MYSQKSWLTYVHSPSGAWCVGHSVFQESPWGASTKSSKGTRTDNDMDAVWFLIAVSCITAFPSCIKRTCIWRQHRECLFSQTSVLIMRFFKSYFSFPISLNMYWIHIQEARESHLTSHHGACGGHLEEGRQRFDFYQIDENNKSSTPEMWTNTLLLK